MERTALQSKISDKIVWNFSTWEEIWKIEDGEGGTRLFSSKAYFKKSGREKSIKSIKSTKSTKCLLSFLSNTTPSPSLCKKINSPGGSACAGCPTFLRVLEFHVQVCSPLLEYPKQNKTNWNFHIPSNVLVVFSIP